MAKKNISALKISLRKGKTEKKTKKKKRLKSQNKILVFGFWFLNCNVGYFWALINIKAFPRRQTRYMRPAHSVYSLSRRRAANVTKAFNDTKKINKEICVTGVFRKTVFCSCQVVFQESQWSLRSIKTTGFLINVLKKTCKRLRPV